MLCIPKELRIKFIKAIKDGSLDVDKLADEPKTDIRRAEFEKVLGKDFGKTANTLFEKGLMAKDQQAGLIRAIKTIGLDPKIEASFLEEISNMDFSYNGGKDMLQDAREQKLGISISDSQYQTLVDLTKKLDKLNPENRNDIKNLIELINSIEKLPNLTQEQKVDIKRIKNELNREKTPEEISKNVRVKISSGLEDISKEISDLARHFVEQGITNPEDLTMAVYDVLKESIPDITPRETMDAISGYGKYRQLSKDEIDVTLRDLKGQMQNLGKLEDMEQGQAPLKSGVERPKMSDEQRRLVQKVNEAKKKGGYDVKDPETQLKSALDTVNNHLKNQIADLEKQIETREKIVKEKTLSPSDAETVTLKAKRDALKKEFDEIFGKKELTDDQRISIANKMLDKSIVKLESDLKEGKLYSDKVERKTPSTPELEAKRAILDSLKAQREELRNILNPKLSPEERSLQIYKARTTAKIAELQAKIDAEDFSPITKAQKPKIYDDEAANLKADLERVKKIIGEKQQESRNLKKQILKNSLGNLKELFGKNIPPEIQTKIDNLIDLHTSGKNKEFGAAKVVMDNYIEALKGSEESLRELLGQAFDDTKEQWKTNKPKAVFDLLAKTIEVVVDNSIALVAAVDNSFMGRQGLKTLMTHPTVWWKAAKNSFIDIAGTLGGKNMKDALLADIYSNPNYMNGRYELAKILPKNEEQYRTSIPGHVPGLGLIFKASEAAFEGSAMRMRTGLYDLISDIAEKNEVDITDEYQIKSMGKMINSLTARGQWGKAGEPTIVRVLLWAPKMLKANIDVLTGHLGQDLSPFARKQAAINLTKIVMTSAIIMAIANAIEPESAETDPRSSNFGKIKVGNTTFDYTGGAASLIVLAARQITGASKSSSTGLITEFGSGFGQQTRFDTLIDFLTGKTTPPVGALISFMKGSTPTGEKATIENVAGNIAIPISVQNAIELKDDNSANAVLGVILDVFGINTNTFIAGSADWTQNTGVELKAFQEEVGDEEFKIANDTYNTEVKIAIESLRIDPRFQELSPEDKKKVISNKKDEIKQKIFRENGFHYKPVKSKPVPKF